MKHVENVLKPDLVMRFEHCWEELRRKYKTEIKPDMVYHGTSDANIPRYLLSKYLCRTSKIDRLG